MDFLDPKKERHNHIGLLVGYALVAIAIGIASTVLLYQTDGYCLDDNREVNRCGLVFLSSQPAGSTIYVNGEFKTGRTNMKLNFRSGDYNIRLTQANYRSWQHSVKVAGGDVQRFDYPFLFPEILKTTTVSVSDSGYAFASQSLNQRWLVTAESSQNGVFTLYNMRNPAKPGPTTLTLPTDVYTVGDGPQTWTAQAWSSDNRHLLLLHDYTVGGVAGQEYIMFDRQSAIGSQNLTKSLQLGVNDRLSLFNDKSTDYFVYNTEAKTLHTASTTGSAPTALNLENVIAFKTYGDNTVLYATTVPPSGKVTEGMVNIVLQQDNRSQVIRLLPDGASQYLMDVAEYSGNQYIVVGSNIEKGVRIYENPFDQKLTTAASLPAPVRFLKVAGPTNISFSTSAHYILAENNQQCIVYDTETSDSYAYTVASPLDAPQTHLKWMDGDRLYYVSGGKAVVADYDNVNRQSLQPASPNFNLFFSGDYKYVFSIITNDEQKTVLTSTALQVQ